MSGITIPVILTIAGIIAAFASYRGIRRGGARFYTLEREAMLRRASFTLMGSMLLFLAAIGLLVYQQQQLTATETPADEAVEEVATETPTPFVNQFPPTETPTITPDPDAPTATPTTTICRAIVEGTGASGLTLRDAPGGAEVTIVPEGSFLTMLDEEPVEANQFTWRFVRVIGGEEGWVADDFLTLGVGCE